MKRIRGKARLLLGYLVLLAFSYFIWGLLPPGDRPAEGKQTRLLNAGNKEQLHIAYDVWGDPADPVVLLLHGSPDMKNSLHGLAERLAAGGFHVLRPDLPGFGGSTRDPADLGIAAQARWMNRFLSEGGWKEVHVGGFSMGGGVAIELARQAPEKVRSLSLLSGLGVQELELFGDYHLNHAVHRLQFGLLYAAKYALPHFGLFPRQPFHLGYARQFLESDLRPIRRYLRRWGKPVWIFHGKSDSLIPVEAAREHARLLPQADMDLVGGGHLLALRRPAVVVDNWIPFLKAVEAGKARWRADAPVAAQRRVWEPFHGQERQRLRGIGRLLLMTIIAVGTLASEDLAGISAGLLAAAGTLGYGSAVLASFLGILIGDSLLYAAGYHFGRPLLEHRWARWFVPRHGLERAQAMFQRYGLWIIIITRFLPGTRAATYFSAGLLRAPFWRFLLVFALAAALWTPLLVGLAFLAGSQLRQFYGAYEVFALPVLIAAGLLVYFVLHYLIPLLTFRGRARLRGKWLRATRWEFWPSWQFNGPLLVYMVMYSLFRYRNPMLVTAVNPLMPHGGFLGESKSAILSAFRGSDEAVARWRRIPSGDSGKRMQAFDVARRELNLPFPVVLKPDEGQRGIGVRIVGNDDEAKEALRETSLPLLLQEFVGGLEAGIFYAKAPSWTRGRILSIVIKKQLQVVGDGESTLEELLHRHPRAVAQLGLFLRRFADRLGEIPAKGATVALGQLGTHALGSLFLDGRYLCSEKLLRSVEAWAISVPGFFFGRFDVKAPDEESLRRGEGLRIMEVNGVTSEAAHIYDPKHGVLAAWRTLAKQWRLAFAIAAENARAGAEVSRFRPFVRDLVKARRRQRPLVGK
ncbi:MAG: alpha/beta fold hydrolase [Verrucomicrobia bacterium]|jgi:membrane protein DedA with SNARE-associated domain/pimeloyl-ACP methyl ester carboxylesterase|nr:alpha/beta fold hydrolase [Verrucomicrobiota bacterium]